jgi:hypothetical protein
VAAIHLLFRSEGEALSFIRRQVPRGTELYAEEGGAWNELHVRYTMHRINHDEAYSLEDEEHETHTRKSSGVKAATH